MIHKLVNFKTMLLILVGIIALSKVSNACQLIVDMPIHFKTEIGYLKTIYFDQSTVAFDASLGDIRTKFNENDLVEITNENETYYFRFAEAIFTSGYTILKDIQWAQYKRPATPSTFLFKSYETTRKPIHNKKMAMVGDSLIASRDARFLRCLLLEQGMPYDFVGEKTDVFGYGNDGLGGDNSKHTISRLDKVPLADAYFVLVGTNDIYFSAIETVNNLMVIANKIHEKNSNALVYISTLLPRHKSQMDRVLAINGILKSNKWGDNIKILDIGGDLSSIQNWERFFHDDYLHPNFEGYQLIAEAIIRNIYK